MKCDTKKLRELFDRGLSSGLGDAEGHVCIEAAINLACGGGLDDAPPCVAEEDRQFAIRLNAASWSSPSARADALWHLALAQIGTSGSDRKAWVARVVEGVIRRIVPEALDAAARAVPGYEERLRAVAERCRQDGSRDAATNAANTAADAAGYAASNATVAAASNASAAYTAAANAYAAAAAADAAAYAAANAAYAADATTAAAYAATAADADYATTYADRDRILTIAVEVALDAYAAEGRHTKEKTND